MLYKNLKGKAGREHLLKEGNYWKPCMVLSKLLVNNLVTKLFEMLLWKCNFISLHDEYCKRVYVSNGGNSNI